MFVTRRRDSNEKENARTGEMSHQFRVLAPLALNLGSSLSIHSG